MKLFAPKCYTEFKCIADRCRHSCCIGWEIDIDDASAEKYASLQNGYGIEIAKSIDFDGVAHFRLLDGERCPHLAPSGLCRIIAELGEDYLCDICREHPRFYNNTPRGREVGLGAACEEACRIILSSDDYREMITLGSVNGEPMESDFDALAARDELYSILTNRTLPYHERLALIYGRFGVSPNELTDGEWRELLGSLEYLDESHKVDFAVYSSDRSTPSELEAPLERALAYFIYRHCAEAQDEDEHRAALGFALFCERLIASVAKAKKHDICEIVRAVSEELDYSEDNTEAIKFEFCC